MSETSVTFTDDDLKRLKENLEKPLGLEDKPIKNIIEALLARLEAAEEVIKECLDHRGKSLIGSDDWHEFYEAWRKAKGE